MIDPGDIWRRVDEIGLREHGKALESVVTTCEIFEEDGIPYQLRVLDGVHPKKVASEEQRKTGTNPFLPPEARLTVGSISSTHALVLNKFNVIGGHLLIVTREFEPQDGFLDVDDFDALLATMAGVDGLGFYNAGPVAGASQPHRHLQVAPLPLLPATAGFPTPVDASIGKGRPLPFAHSLVKLDGGALTRSDAPGLFELSSKLIDGLLPGGRDRSFNLLLTRRWMMVVPRTRDRFESVSVNALGFAGSILVRDRERLQVVKDIGPSAVLRGVAGA